MIRTVDDARPVHAALAEPVRLAIVDRLGLGDASPGELGASVGLGSNLLAHHLKVLEEAGVIRRVRSEGDRRRSYVQLCLDDPIVWAAAQAGQRSRRPVRCRGWCSCAPPTRRDPSWPRPGGTRSARSRPRRPAPIPRSGCTPARSPPAGGTGSALERRATRCHRGPVCGTGTWSSRSATTCTKNSTRPCDRLHWSIPDPVRVDTDEAFEAAYADITRRVERLASPPSRRRPT